MNYRRPSDVCDQAAHSLYATTPEAAGKLRTELEYYRFVASLQNAWAETPAAEPMLRVATTGLYAEYLVATQVRPCRKCKEFFDAYGGAVRVDSSTGRVTSALWNGCANPSTEYGSVADILSTRCESRPVIGVFATYATHLCGRSFGAGRGHMHIYRNHRLEPVTDLHAAFDAVSSNMERFSLSVVSLALGLLRQLGGERVRPMIAKLSWMAAHLRRAANIRDSDRRRNLLWYDMASVDVALFDEGHPALHMLLRNLADGLRPRSALAELSRTLDRSPRQWP